MAEIYHWRKRIQPNLLRQPTTRSEVEDTDPEHAHCSSFRKSSRSRPKLSTYFTHHPQPTDQDKPMSFLDSTHFPPLAMFPSSVSDEVSEESEFDVHQVMDSIMRKLMAEPYRSLDIKHNSSLLMIFESYRTLHDHNNGLVERLGQEVEARYAEKLDVENANSRWEQEREGYRAEIKRLELIIAKGKGGVAGVMQARQGSTLRKGRQHRPTSTTSTAENYRETLVEFLKRSRAEDKATGMPSKPVNRGRQGSPSQKMAELSHRLSTIDHHNDLPFDSPPSPLEYTSLSQASYYESMLARTSLSDTDSFGTDPGHQDRVSRVTLTDENLNEQRTLKGYKHVPSDANTTSAGQKNGILGHSNHTSSNYSPNNNDTVRPSLQRAAIHKNPDSGRRFSFELGDDLDSQQEQQHKSSSHLIQRSFSVSQVPPKPTRNRSYMGLGIYTEASPVSSPPLMSPSLATPTTESQRLSKIPSPAFDASLARPRREDSTSSFFTVVKVPSGSPSHSREHSRSSISIDSPRQHSSSSTARYGSLRDTNMAVAAARAVGTKNVHGSITGNDDE